MADPIAAFKRQQAWSGFQKDGEADGKSEDELRKIHPRWSKIFNQIDVDQSGTLELDEVREGFGKVVGAGCKIPTSQVDELFGTFDTDKAGKLSFVQFVKLSKAVNAYMQNNPNWGAIEDAKEEKKRKEEAAEAKARKEKEVPDVFALLGMKKSKDQVKFEEEKKRKAEAHANTFIKAMSRNSIGAKPEEGFGAKSKFANKWGAAFNRRGTAPPSLGAAGSMFQTKVDIAEEVDPIQKLRDAWEPRTCAPYTAPRSKRLAVHNIIQLPNASKAKEKKEPVACFSLRFSSDAKRLAGVFFDGALRVYDVDKGTVQHCLGIPQALGGTEKEKADDKDPAVEETTDPAVPEAKAQEVAFAQRNGLTSVCWRPKSENSFEGSHIATGDTAGVVSLWDFTEVKPRLAYSHQTPNEICGVAFTHDGNKLLATGSGREMHVYDVQQSLQELQAMSLEPPVFSDDQITGHTLKVVALAAHPRQSDVFFTAGLDKGAYCWDLRTGKYPVTQFTGPEVSGDAMSVLQNGNELICGSHRHERQLEIFDLRFSGKGIEATESWDFNSVEDDMSGVGYKKGEMNSKVFACCFDHAGRHVATAGSQQNVTRVFERANGPTAPCSAVGTFNGGSEAFWSVTMGSSNRHDFTAAGSADGTVSILRMDCR